MSLSQSRKFAVDMWTINKQTFDNGFKRENSLTIVNK